MTTQTRKPPTDAVLSLTEAARYLGVSASTVRRLRDAGTLKGHRATPSPNSHWRFMRSDLLRYLRNQQEGDANAIYVYTRTAEAGDRAILEELLASDEDAEGSEE